MKKTVIRVNVSDESRRQKVLKSVAKLQGIKDMSIDIEKGTLTVVGGVDPVCIIKRLRKCRGEAMIDSVGAPPKPPDDKDKDKDKDKVPPYCNPCLPPCPPVPMYGYVEHDPNPCVIL